MCPQFSWKMPMAELLHQVVSLVWSDRWSVDPLSLPALCMAAGWGGVIAIATFAAVIAAIAQKGRRQ